MWKGKHHEAAQCPSRHHRTGEDHRLLLNPAHPDNGGKAAFFSSLGFQPDNWQSLADAFRKQTVTGLVTKSVASPHGAKYILDGQIESPSGRTPVVRTIRIVDEGQAAPRLVTAYPHEE